MKCIGKETPPCNRCRQAGHRCTFDGPRKSKNSKVEEWVFSLSLSLSLSAVNIPRIPTTRATRFRDCLSGRLVLISRISRLRLVEVQMGGMHSALEELLRLQRAAVPGADPIAPHHFSVAEGTSIRIRPLLTS